MSTSEYTLVGGQQTEGTWVHTGKLIVSRRLDSGALSSVTLPDTLVTGGTEGAWFANRRWYPLGTSLTSQGFYTGRLAALSGMNMVDNLGASGGSLCGVGGTANANVWAKLVTVPTDAEVVTLECCNDVRLSATLGTMADPETNGHMISFYGAMKEACAWLLTNRPAARVFMITNYSDALTGSGWGNFRNPNLNGNFPYQFNDVIRQIAGIYGIPVLEVAEESGINYFTNQWFTSDTIHLNDLGGQRFAEYCWSRMSVLGWLDSRPTNPGGIVIVAVTGVTIDQGTAVSVAPGGTTQLSYAITPSNATNKSVHWSSATPAAATVSANGLVTGVANGSSVVTVTTVDGGKTASITVTVATAAVSGVTLSPPTATVNLPNGTLQLVATVLPSNAGNKAVTFASSDSSKATVSATGLVTAVAVGSVTITCTTDEGGFTATSAITVAVVPVTGITLVPSAATIALPGTQQLTPTVAPANASNKTVTYASSDVTKATVSGTGLITAVAVGSVTITATTQDGGFTATSAIYVSAGESWTMIAQTTFRGIELTGVTATGSNPTYAGVTGTFGALLINTPGDNAIEFAIGDGTKGHWACIGSNGTTDFSGIGDTTAGAFGGYIHIGIFASGGYISIGTPTPAANPAVPGTGVIYRIGRIGNRVKIVRVDAGPTLVTIWDGDLATNFPSNAAAYATLDLGVVAIGAPGTSYTLPINCKTGTWTP